MHVSSTCCDVGVTLLEEKRDLVASSKEAFGSSELPIVFDCGHSSRADTESVDLRRHIGEGSMIRMQQQLAILEV